MEAPQFNSPNSVAKRQTVPIDVDDPRLSKFKQGMTRARQGAEVQVVDISGTANLTTGSINSLIQVGSGNQLSAQDSNLFSATYTQILNAIANPGPNDPTGRPNVVNLGSISNLTTAWSGTDLTFSFDFDPNLTANMSTNEFAVHAISSSATGSVEGISFPGTFKINKSLTNHTFTFTQAINIQTMGTFVYDFASFCVYPIDTFGINSGAEVCAIPQGYTLDLSAPIITVSQINNGYSVSYTKPTSSSFVAIDIVEYESDTTPPTNAVYNRTYLGDLNPAIVIAPNFNKRYVKARFSSVSGKYTDYSAPVDVTPKSVVSVDSQPPNLVTNPSGVWSGDNIIISYTQPASDAPTRVLVQLNATANTSAYGYFYSNPAISTGVQTFTISKRDLYLQFGQYYSQYSAKISGFDAVGNQSADVSFQIAARANGMSSVTPTPIITAQPSGYTAVFDFSNTAATNAEIYEFFTTQPYSWMQNDVPDYYAGTYSSGGSIGSNTIVLTSLHREGAAATFDPSEYIGYQVSGYGVPANTYVTSISGTGPYTFTLSNNLLYQAKDIYTFRSLVYAGQSPANIFSSFYHSRYVAVAYYDDFGNRSQVSTPVQITPIDPGAVSLINNPITFSTSGSILAGDSDTSFPRAIFNKTGLYVYDANGNETTQIIGNAANGTNTFITTKAQIADWSISDSTIQNDLHISGSNYTGLSASGTYAIWAGASTPANSLNDAKFSVKPDGSVIAKNISIIGSGSGTLINAGNVFTVTNAGVVTITGSADIKGKITATDGSFDGNLSIGALGSIYTGTVTPGAGATPPSLTTAGFILNKNGLKFNKFENNTLSTVTQIDATSGLLTTTSASIGGWSVDSSTIKKVNTGVGSIVLHSGDGSTSTSIYATSSDNTHSAGIIGNTSTSNYTQPAFWAGQATPSTASSAAFYVEYTGKLHSTSADITGTVKSSGALGTITLDGDHDLISIGSGAGASQIFTRDAIPGTTSGKTTFFTNSNPFLSNYTIDNTALQANPYIAIGSNINSFGTVMSGIGLYTSNSYINVTTSNGVGIMTGDSSTSTVKSGIILKDGKVSIGAVTTSGSGANATYSIAPLGAATITLEKGNTTYGDVIQIVSRTTRNPVLSPNADAPSGTTANTDANSAYVGASQITISASQGVLITGLPVQGNMTLSYQTYFNSFYPNGKSDPARGPGYLNVTGLGPVPRQRSIVEDPVTGVAKLGFAVYYQDTNVDGQAPGQSSGYVGDLWVQY